MHFGARTADHDRVVERDLIDCLTAHDDVTHLYLVGDVYDCYVEYPSLVPKGIPRLKGLLAQWTDAGIPVTYLVGNHDPWHLDFFETELGVRVEDDPVSALHFGQHVHLEHGDAVASTHRSFPSLRPWMRHPIPIRLYRTLLPADLGQRFAQWVSRAVRDHDSDPDVIRGLEGHARRLLGETPADLVVMGHSHVAALQDVPGGTYLNTGFWAQDRTFGRLDEDGVALLRWNGTEAVNIQTDRA